MIPEISMHMSKGVIETSPVVVLNESTAGTNNT